MKQQFVKYNDQQEAPTSGLRSLHAVGSQALLLGWKEDLRIL